MNVSGRLHCARRENTTQRAQRPTIRHVWSNQEKLPKFYNATDHYKNECPGIREIWDQSQCGSCWAVAAVAAMSDRICIRSLQMGKANVSFHLSAVDLISCCSSCGEGCFGGWPAMAWDYWKNNGIVTGGTWENQFGCRSYPFPACGQPEALFDCSGEFFFTPQCFDFCDGPKVDYKTSKTFGAASYNVPSNANDIMLEIKKHGPVEATIDVYADFMGYHSGIYFHAWGGYQGGHAVRIVGWGEENGVPYWLVANSWGATWGEGGYVRFLRGENECGIEEGVVAGTPDLRKLWKMID